MKFWRGQQKAEVHSEKAPERKCQNLLYSRLLKKKKCYVCLLYLFLILDCFYFAFCQSSFKRINDIWYDMSAVCVCTMSVCCQQTTKEEEEKSTMYGNVTSCWCWQTHTSAVFILKITALNEKLNTVKPLASSSFWKNEMSPSLVNSDVSSVYAAKTRNYN